jgi:type IV pilus assembly protein PilV
MQLRLPNTARWRAAQRGFTVVEVMVAVIVICVGLLGIAKMQALALSNMNTSRQRALAAIEAASLASAMHSNRNYWAVPTAATSTGVAFSPIVITSTDGTLASTATADVNGGATGLAACVGTSNGIAKCTPAQLAAYDVANWANDIAGVLPNPAATITCASNVTGTPPSCTIKIQWSETAVAITQQAAQQQGAAGAAQFEIPTYLLYVEP